MVFQDCQIGLVILTFILLQVNSFNYGGHGSCVASKAVGNVYGVAKSANLIIVKKPVATDQWQDPNTGIMYPKSVLPFSALEDALNKIKSDVQSRQQQKVYVGSVVNFSLGSPKYEDAAEQSKYQQLITDLIGLGVVIVATSGNNREAHFAGVSFASRDVISHRNRFWC